MIRKYIVLLTMVLNSGSYVWGMDEVNRISRDKIKGCESFNKEYSFKNTFNRTRCNFDLNSFKKECSTRVSLFGFAVAKSYRPFDGLIEEYGFDDKVIDPNAKFDDLELEYFKKEAQKGTSEEVVTKKESFVDQEVSYQVGSEDDYRFCLKKSNEDPECWRSVRTNRWFFPTKKMKINPALYYAFKQMYENQQQADLEKSFE